MAKKKTMNGTRKMTPEEIFASRMEYFRKNEELFSPSQVNFLKSVISYGENYPITVKQADAFIKTVNAVWTAENRFRILYMKAIYKTDK